MKFSKFKEAVLSPFDKLQSESGEEFLELMVETIVLEDDNAKELAVLNGWEYSLSRSRHWDKEQENYIMYDGFSDNHLEELLEDIEETEIIPARIVLNIEGMNDLEEAIHKKIIVELSKIND
ncbi:MAG: hypothetical protein U9O95_02130 [Candidatus Marinimicrobia bacterium]|nr:hypothetical protein [Candidatus Neomarinimicrobiota bacterium]